MEVYNKEKTQILTDYDLEKGYLMHDKLIHNISNIEEELVYKPKLKRVLKKIEEDEKYEFEPYEIEEQILIYIPYTEQELEQQKYERQLNEYKQLLSDTDYEAIKYAEGYFTEEEYAKTKQLRESYREKVREAEDYLKNIKDI